MDAKSSFDFEADPARRLARTYFNGHVTAAVMKPRVAAFEAAIKKMKPGFTILADMGGIEAMDLDCGPYLAKIMDLCRSQGVGKVVRVVPDPSKDIGVNILSIVHYRGKVPIATCETLEKALKEVK